MTPLVRTVEKPFLYLRDAAAWENPVLNEQVTFDEALSALRLGDERTTPIAIDEPGGTFAGLTLPTGVAVGDEGRLFLADPERNQILTYTPASGKFEALWPARAPVVRTDEDKCLEQPVLAPEPPGVYTLLAPRGVAISGDGDLVVADTGHARILIYAWPSLVVRHVIHLPGGEPWDIAYDSNGYLYVADAKRDRVERFDRLWRRDLGYLGGVPLLKTPRHLAMDDHDRLLVINAGASPRIDCTTWETVAESGFPVIVALDVDGKPNAPPIPSLFARRLPLPLRLEASKLWLPQASRPRCPALLLRGLEVDRRGRLRDLGLMLLALPATVRYPRFGRWISAPFDSKLFACAWHRLLFEVDLPVGTSLTVRTFSNPTPLDAARIRELSDNGWSRSLTIAPGDPPEILVQSAAGQVLWVELSLTGDGAATPIIRSLTVYAPRASSLGFLPPVFHEDPVSADFLDRFLSYFDTIFAEIESQIERFSGYLDPDGVPTSDFLAGDFLSWLGSWLDVEFLRQWPEATRREFVRQAIALYKQRGTIPGLQAILRLHGGIPTLQPIIIEHFRLRAYQTQRTVSNDLVDGKLYIGGQPLDPPTDQLPHHFTVVVPNRIASDEEALATLHQVIEAQKPAHTNYHLRVIEPGVRIGCQSTIGVDMLIGPYPSAALGEMRLSSSSQLRSN